MCDAADNRAAQMSLTLTLSRYRERELRKEEGGCSTLGLGVVMLRRTMCTCERLVYRIVGLRAAQMHRRVAGDFRAESQVASAVSASLVRDFAQQMALAMVAGAAAWTVGRSRRRYNENAHFTVLAFVPRQAMSLTDRVSLAFCKISTHTVCARYSTNS